MTERFLMTFMFLMSVCVLYHFYHNGPGLQVTVRDLEYSEALCLFAYKQP